MATKTPSTFYARLVPSTRGNPVLRFCLSGSEGTTGLLMQGGAVPTWYEVTATTALRLRDIHEQGRRIIELVTREERQAIEERELAERAAAVVLAQRVAPLAVAEAPVVSLSGRDAARVGPDEGVVTTADLPGTESTAPTP